jgi:hypothetical protein
MSKLIEALQEQVGQAKEYVAFTHANATTPTWQMSDKSTSVNFATVWMRLSTAANYVMG